jgi:hypothetical protein
MLTTGYTPIFQVVKDGVDVTSKFQDRLVQVQVQQTEASEMGRIEFIFDDRDWALALPQIEDKVSFLLGYKETGLSDFGEFTINEVHLIGPPRSIKVVGTSVSQSSALKVPKITNYLDQTVGDIIKQIAGQSGITADVDPSIGSIKVPAFNQNNQSGFHIIDQLARTYGASAVYQNGRVSVVKRGSASTTSGSESGSVNLTPEDFGEWDVWIQSRAAYSGAQAAWYDKDNVTRKYEQAQASGSSLSNFPLIGNEFSNPDKFFTLPGTFQTQEQAKAAAEARINFLEQLRAQITLTLAKGDPTIRVHQNMNISGMRYAIDGAYIIQTVTHSYRKTTGIVTSIEATTLSAS